MSIWPARVDGDEAMGAGGGKWGGGGDLLGGGGSDGMFGGRRVGNAYVLRMLGHHWQKIIEIAW
jgi:hypothetical protein